jgi:hypothetical protein
VKKWYWSLGLFIVSTFVGMKGAIISSTGLIVHMAVGAASGFVIGLFLDWRDAKRKRRPHSSA